MEKSTTIQPRASRRFSPVFNTHASNLQAFVRSSLSIAIVFAFIVAAPFSLGNIGLTTLSFVGAMPLSWSAAEARGVKPKRAVPEEPQPADDPNLQQEGVGGSAHEDCKDAANDVTRLMDCLGASGFVDSQSANQPEHHPKKRDQARLLKMSPNARGIAGDPERILPQSERRLPAAAGAPGRSAK